MSKQKVSFNRCTNLIFFFLILFSFPLAAQKWEPMGPFITPSLSNPNDFTLRMANGIGRVTCLRFSEFDSTQTRALYLGSPYGGLFKSIDNAQSWDEIPTGEFTPGISDFVFHPKNNKNLFILTGDPDCILDPNNPALGSEACQSGGIFESKDGGTSWSDTPIGNWYDSNGKVIPDFWKFPSLKVMRRLLINPVSPKIMFTVLHTYNYGTKSFDGYIYKSVDGGKNWRVSLFSPGGKLKDIEFYHANPKIIYAGGNTVYRTSDNGKKWMTLQKNGLPEDSLVFRCEITTVAAKPDLLYVLVSNKKSRQNEIYFSRDKGNSFQLVGSAPLSPDWRTALAVMPADTSLIYFTSGNKLSCYKSDGNQYRYTSTAGNIHDDIHDITIDPFSGRVYASTDGGLYMSPDSGKTWKEMNYGLNVAECWSIAVSQNGPQKIISGLQDCGTIYYNEDSTENFVWMTVRGGDGMTVAYNHLNPMICYSADGNNNIFSRSLDGGRRWSRNLGIFDEPFTYLHPFVLNPQNPASILLPYHNVYKSINGGEKFYKLPGDDLPDNREAVCAIAIAPSDSNYIYIAYTNPSWNENPKEKIYVSEDGGMSWEDISDGLDGVKYQNITCIAVNPKNPKIVTVGFKGGGKLKVMQSEETGMNKSWRDISNGLPPEADVNDLLYDSGDRKTIFAATHRGVWQLNSDNTNWLPTGEGLPRMMVSDIDICSDSHVLFAGTHGRGIWKMVLQ